MTVFYKCFILSIVCTIALSCSAKKSVVDKNIEIELKTTKEGFPNKTVRDFGAIGNGVADDTKAVQSAIDAYKNGTINTVIFDPGTYRITSSLKYQTKGYSRGLQLKGAGEATVIRFEHKNGRPLFEIDGSTAQPYQFQRGGSITDIYILGSGIKSGSQGAAISITGWWMYSIEDVIIREVDGTGIEFPLRTKTDSNPDAYASVMGTIHNTEIAFCTGWGIDAASGIGFGGNMISQCRIGENKGGGIRLGGHFNTISQNAIFSNGNNTKNPTGGILIQRMQSNANNINILNNELDNNRMYHVHLDGISGGQVSGNRCNSWNSVFNDDSMSPSTHILMKPVTKRAAVTNVILENNYHRSQYKKSGARRNYKITLYDFGNDGNVSHIQVRNPIIPKEDNTPIMELYENMNTISNISIKQNQKPVNQAKQSAAVSIRLKGDVNIDTNPTKVKFNSILMDYQNDFNIKENSFKAPYSGLYNLSFGLTTSNMERDNELRVYVKGTITHKMFYMTGHGLGNHTHSGTCNVYLNKGDKIWLEVETQKKVVKLKTGNIHNWFDISSIN